MGGPGGRTKGQIMKAQAGYLQSSQGYPNYAPNPEGKAIAGRSRPGAIEL